MGEDSKVPPLSRRVPGATAHSRPAGRVAPPKLPESLLRSVRAALEAEPKPTTDQPNGASPNRPSPKAGQPSPKPADQPSPKAGQPSPEPADASSAARPASLPRRMPGTTYGPKAPARAARPVLPTSLLGRRSAPEPEATPEDATQPIPAISEAVIRQLASPAVDEDAASPARPPGEAVVPPVKTAALKKMAAPEKTVPPKKTARPDKAAARGEAAPDHASKTRAGSRSATTAPKTDRRGSARAARAAFRAASTVIPVARDSRPATNGRTDAANGAAATVKGRAAEAAGNRDRQPTAPAASPPAAEWWVQERRRGRKTRTGRRYRLIGVVASVIVLVAAGAVAFVATQSPSETGPNGAALSAAQLRAEAVARSGAAAWVASQVSRTSVVACDPVMCRALQAHGFPSAQLLPLGPAAPYPVNSAVVVATPAVRSQFGSSLAAAYAPAVLASFGTGITRIDIRVIAPDGAAQYLAELKADVAARKQSARLLLHSSRFVVPAAAARQLEAGEVDTRLLIATADIAPSSPMIIVAFGGSVLGASPGIPLRYVDLTRTSGAALTPRSPFVESVLGTLSNLQPPYRPSGVQFVRAAGGQTFLRIEFAAPSPLGLIGH